MSNLSLSVYPLFLWIRLGVWGLVFDLQVNSNFCQEFKLREVLMCPVLFHTGNDKFALKSFLTFSPFFLSLSQAKVAASLTTRFQKNLSSNNI